MLKLSLKIIREEKRFFFLKNVQNIGPFRKVYSKRKLLINVLNKSNPICKSVTSLNKRKIEMFNQNRLNY